MTCVYPLHACYAHNSVITLPASEAAVQCIVIGPVCEFVCVRVGSVTTITRNCVHRSSPNWVCR